MNQADHDITRDKRFKYIIEEQLGKKGLIFIINQSVLFILSLIIIVSIMIGVIGGTSCNQLRLPHPIVVAKHRRRK